MVQETSYIPIFASFHENILRASHIHEKSQEATLLAKVHLNKLIVTHPKQHDIETFKGQMKEFFDMSDLGFLNHYLRIKFTLEKDWIKILD